MIANENVAVAPEAAAEQEQSIKRQKMESVAGKTRAISYGFARVGLWPCLR